MIQAVFNKATEPQRMRTIEDDMADRWDSNTASKVMETLKAMQIPVPERGEYQGACEGFLIFMNKFGVIVRIETKNSYRYSTNFNRIDHPRILQPLASRVAGRVIVEICPGGTVATDREQTSFLRNELKKSGINYWDAKMINSGVLPIKLPEFPDGYLVVIDRLAVRRLTSGVELVKSLLRKVFQGSAQKAQAKNPQTEFYAPLREAFQAAWKPATTPETIDVAKMKAFWTMCEEFTDAGKLLTGWDALIGPRFVASLYNTNKFPVVAR